MLTVTTAATNKKLTTLIQVKTELGVSGGGDDAWLNGQIDVASRLVCNYLNVGEAEDGSITLAQETLSEVIDRRGTYPWPYGTTPQPLVPPKKDQIILSRRPVASISSITSGDTTLTSSDYTLKKAAGLIERVSESLPSQWEADVITIAYVAGWVLPGTMVALFHSRSRTR